MTWQFTLTGLLIGALVGLTGMGGGSLLTPILVIAFGFKPTYAVGTDILHGAIFKSFGAARCRQLGTVHARLAAWMFLGSGPMSLAGVALASALGSGAEKAEAYAVGVTEQHVTLLVNTPVEVPDSAAALEPSSDEAGDATAQPTAVRLSPPATLGTALRSVVGRRSW